ncbi:MAG: ROK family protein [Clostridiales bacterium]|nr:ROK family protein [Clostridiales bacterium]
MKVIALDIGGTKISGAVVTSSGEMIDVRQRPTEAVKGAGYILDSAFSIIDDLIANTPGIKGIGIASAGRINVEDGSVLYATPNLPGWTGLNLRKIFLSKYSVPVIADNDVNAAAIGEGWLGAAKDLDSYVCITLGTGVGGAFVVDNKVWRGNHWSGAELGHMILKAGGCPCNCGLSGCAEQYVSGTAIYKRYNEMSIKKVKSAYEVFEQLKRNDSKARIVIDEFKQDLTDMLLSLNNIFDPQGYVIGGGLLGAREYWWDDVVNGVNQYKPTKLLPAKLGNHAGLAGAAKLIIEYILEV